MKLVDFKVLTDENIQTSIVGLLRQLGFDVLDVKEQRWAGSSDQDLLDKAYIDKRVIFTHDSDFGKIVFTQNIPFVGIIYLRPGHFSSSVTEKTIKVILKKQLTFTPPFILVAENTGSTIKLRYREVR